MSNCLKCDGPYNGGHVAWEGKKGQSPGLFSTCHLIPMYRFPTTCKLKSSGQFSTWYMTMCHGISGHVAEQSMSLNVSKTNVK